MELVPCAHQLITKVKTLLIIPDGARLLKYLKGNLSHNLAMFKN